MNTPHTPKEMHDLFRARQIQRIQRDLMHHSVSAHILGFCALILAALAYFRG